jgi:hypothetical protein
MYIRYIYIYYILVAKLFPGALDSPPIMATVTVTRTPGVPHIYTLLRCDLARGGSSPLPTPRNSIERRVEEGEEEMKKEELERGAGRLEKGRGRGSPLVARITTTVRHVLF